MEKENENCYSILGLYRDVGGTDLKDKNHDALHGILANLSQCMLRLKVECMGPTRGSSISGGFIPILPPAVEEKIARGNFHATPKRLPCCWGMDDQTRG